METRKWDVDLLTFSASSSVVVECREAGRQASNRCRVDAMAVGGYISGVIFVDGGFCVGNKLSGFQAASSCIEHGQRAGFRAWEWAMDAESRRVYRQAHLTRGAIKAES